MKGFYIEITNNLLDPKHRKKMGTAIWEFMWCLDKITKIDDDGLGWIYGGKPIQLKEIRAEIGITEPKISKNLNKLAKEGYLILLRTPHGLVIKVCKAKKRFAQKEKRFALKGKTNNLKGKCNIRQDIDINNNKGLYYLFGNEKCKVVPNIRKSGAYRILVKGEWQDFGGAKKDLIKG